MRGKTHIMGIVFTLLLLMGFRFVFRDHDADALRVHIMEADYPVYTSLSDIVADSTAVVRGTIEEVLPAYRVIPEEVPLDQLPPEKAASIGFMVTDVVIRVNQVLWGDPSIAGSSIVVPHLGGTDGKDIYIIEEEPISQAGQAYLLFLERVDNGRYVIVGGNQGRYVIQHDRLQSISSEAESLPLVRALQNTDLESLERQLAHLGDVTQPQLPGHEIQEPLTGEGTFPSPESKP